MAGTPKDKARRRTATNDCRITARCLRETFGLKAPAETEFARLRTENSLVDAFFDALEGDPDGGEGGERVRQITSRPAFKLTFGRMRGATWFDLSHPPQNIVWLLGAEMHDDRHKGRSDAYDILGRLDARGELFPTDLDYRRLELEGFESFVFWTGRITGSRFEVRHGHVPRQTARRSRSGLSVRVEGDALHKLNVWLFENREILGAQVHAHPTEAYHSETDDTFPIVTTLGGLSLVVPDFCRAGLLDHSAAYRLTSDGWAESETPLTELIAIA